MALFTVIADHEDGASSFSQVEAETVRGALIRWAEGLVAAPWDDFSETQREEIIEQIEQDADEESSSTGIEGCRFLWRENYLLSPGDRSLRVMIIKTADQ
jgi:hypothetical protein